MDFIFLGNNFRIYLKVKSKFFHNFTRKNLFLSACYYSDGTISLREMGQKFLHGGKIGYGNSYLNSVFRYSKIFTLHAILNDAAGKVRLQTGRGPGYWNMIGWGPNCCLLGHVTGLLFCLYVKIFLPSIFNLIDFWISLSLIVLDIEPTAKNIIKEPGLFIDGSLQRFSFCPPKTFKPNEQTTWNTSHLHGIVLISGNLEFENLFAVLYDIKILNAEVFAKLFEKCRLLTRLLGKNVESLDDYGCPKIQDLVGERKTDSFWICSSYPFWHKTRLLCAEKKAKVYGDWAMQHLNLYILNVLIVFVFTTILFLSTRHYLFYSTHFKIFVRWILGAWSDW